MDLSLLLAGLVDLVVGILPVFSRNQGRNLVEVILPFSVEVVEVYVHDLLHEHAGHLEMVLVVLR